MKFRTTLGLYSALTLATAAGAREYQELFPTAKARSMGFAMTAIVDDEASLYSNPAGLAQIKRTTLHLPDLLQVGISPSILDIYHSISGIPSNPSVQQIVNALNSYDGDSVCVNLDVLGLGYYTTNFAVGLNLASAHACARVHTPSALFASIDARVTVDSGVSLGFAHSLVEDFLRAGITLRPFIMREGFDQTLQNTDILNLKGSALQQYIGEGWGFDFDVGLQGNLKSFPYYFLQLKPMFGITMQNALATQFPNQLRQGQSGQPPPPLERKVNFGAGMSAENLGAFKPTVSVEWRDTFTPAYAMVEHLSAAVELALKPRRWFSTALRGHLYKGNFGGGIGLKLSALEMEFGTYAVNLGNGPGIGVDRELYAQLSLVW